MVVDHLKLFAFLILLCVLQPRWQRLNKITIHGGENSQEKCDKYHMQFFKKSNITNMIVHNSTVWNGSIECMTPSVTQPITNHLDNWHFMMILTYLSLCYAYACLPHRSLLYVCECLYWFTLLSSDLFCDMSCDNSLSQRLCHFLWKMIQISWDCL